MGGDGVISTIITSSSSSSSTSAWFGIYLVNQLKVSPLLINPKAPTVHLSTHSTPLCGTSCMQDLHSTVVIVIGIAVVYGSLLLEHILTFFEVFDKLGFP
jgi:hypothetical protein